MLMDLVTVNFFFLSRLFPIEHILFFHHHRRYLEYFTPPFMNENTLNHLNR